VVRLNDILEKIEEYNPAGDLAVIKKAYVFSAKVHQGQNRLSGEPYLNHPLEVSRILAQLKMDVPTIVTGLLHDTVEDTKATLEEIESLFGSEIMFLVDGVTKISKMVFSTKEERQAESLRKMVISMAKDIRVVIIKLADRLHNIRTLQHHSPEKSKAIAQETLDIYAPLANRLGISWIKSELEDHSLRYIKPEIYKDLIKKVAKKKKEREKYILEVKMILDEKLAEHDIRCEIYGRPKHFFSIYKKMETQGIDFEQINDLIAFRIIAENVRECYEALGIIHSLWKPVPGRFKDYIAIPKGNMYQSLHTTVIGPKGERLEIQMRTEEMHRVAEQGIAAHWKYKEGKGFSEHDDERFGWLRQIMEWQQDMQDPKSFMESFRTDLFTDEVYVFTPEGDVIELPLSATPVDFAFRIHTDIGMKCAGARVNGAIVPLKYHLRNGDTVEILTSPKHTPSKDWLRFVKTSKARTSIMHWSKKEERKQSIDVGKEILERELRKRGKSLSKILKDKSLPDMMKAFHIKTEEDMMSAISYGKITSTQLIEKLFPEEGESGKKKKSKSRLDSIIEKISFQKKGAVEIQGIDDLLIRYAQCCNPIAGDKIIGFITRGRGVTVHRIDCAHVQESDPERRIELQWSKDAVFTRPVKIKVICKNEKGLLANLTARISDEKLNINSAQINTAQANACCIFEIDVQSLAHLEKVINSLQKVKGVSKVERVSA